MKAVTIMADTSRQTPLILTAYRINAALVTVIRDLGSMEVTLDETPMQRFLSPVCEITVGNLRFYASGVADELEARFRL